jgi:hypothetical protein
MTSRGEATVAQPAEATCLRYRGVSVILIATSWTWPVDPVTSASGGGSASFTIA